MKKLLALLLATAMLLSIAACGQNKTEPTGNEDEEIVETVTQPEADEKTEDKKEDGKTEAEKKPDDKKEEVKEPDKKQEAEEKPADKAEEKPEEKPAAPASVGNTLLSVFKAKAASSSALTIAEALAQHESIPFMAGASAVEPGLLTGFDNAEITGFKEGAMFAPMMSSVAFVGYVFTLEDGVNASDFIASLKKSANLRWNICVEAEEMVTGSVGNKVFFVMCPKQFEE